VGRFFDPVRPLTLLGSRPWDQSGLGRDRADRVATGQPGYSSPNDCSEVTHREGSAPRRGPPRQQDRSRLAATVHEPATFDQPWTGHRPAPTGGLVSVSRSPSGVQWATRRDRRPGSGLLNGRGSAGKGESVNASAPCSQSVTRQRRYRLKVRRCRVQGPRSCPGARRVGAAPPGIGAGFAPGQFGRLRAPAGRVNRSVRPLTDLRGRAR
jgi:hypothetical protein